MEERRKRDIFGRLMLLCWTTTSIQWLCGCFVVIVVLCCDVMECGVWCCGRRVGVESCERANVPRWFCCVRASESTGGRAPLQRCSAPSPFVAAGLEYQMQSRPGPGRRRETGPVRVQCTRRLRAHEGCGSTGGIRKYVHRSTND